MKNAVQMNFNFEEPPEMEAFVKKLKEKKIPEAETDRLTNHFEEVKTTELITQILRSTDKEYSPACRL